MTPQHSYIIPEDDHYLISFSGGRSSAYMLRKIIDANKGIPENAHVVFANTGKEHAATYDFVEETASRWNVEITWLEYRYDTKALGGRYHPKNQVHVVDYKTASRNGEPFDSLINAKKFLPNVATRLCTSELKIQTIDRHFKRNLGIKKYKKFLGIRYDEKKRWAKAMLVEDCNTLFPMVTDMVIKHDVLRFWKSQSFDLKIPSELGNCDMCFLKTQRKLLDIIKDDPSRADWWIEKESYHWLKSNQFNKNFSYEYLKSKALGEKTLFDMPLENEIDCFCGD